MQDDDGGDGKRSKTSGNSKGEENSSGKHAEETSDEPHPKKDYIHVRARRGQATDSHSLAERVFSYFLFLTKCIFIGCSISYFQIILILKDIACLCCFCLFDFMFYKLASKVLGNFLCIYLQGSCS